MRVLQLVGPSTGGIRQHVAALASDLRALGLDVVVAAPPGVFDELGGAYAVVDVPSGPDPVAAVRAARQVRALAPSGTLVHAHGLKAGWVAFVGRRRFVLTVHNVVLDVAAGRAARVLRRLERFIVGRAAGVIATSAEIAASLDRSSRVIVVPPAHIVRKVERARDVVRAALGIDGPLVVTVARLHPQKGVDLLVGAAALLAPEITILVVGDGPQRDELDGLVEQLGVGDRVRLLGERNDALDLLAAADVVVIPSRWESGPLVLLEAMQLGRPVVTTMVGLVPRVVDAVGATEERPLVVAEADPTSIADAISTLLADPAACKRLGASARAQVGPFLDREAGVAAIVALYAEVAG